MRRLLGARGLDRRLSQVAGAPVVLGALMDDYAQQCPNRGAPLYYEVGLPDCDGMLAQMRVVVDVVGRVLDDAEEAARRSRLEPGLVRDLRDRHGLDEGEWDRSVGRLRDLEAEARRR